MGTSEINFEDLIECLRYMYRLGYEDLAISGGEPSIYPDILPLIRKAHHIGYAVTAVSNGLLPAAASKMLNTKLLSALTISIDGHKEKHNVVRGRDDAFTRAISSIEMLVDQATSQKFPTKVGVSISVFGDSIRKIPELVYFVSELQVNHINLHPISPLGRAQDPDFSPLSEIELLRLSLVARALQTELPEVLITCDVYASQKKRYNPTKHDLLNPVVIDETGLIVPFTYGITREMSLGSVKSFPHSFQYKEEHINLVTKTFSDADQYQASNFYSTLEKNAADALLVNQAK